MTRTNKRKLALAQGLKQYNTGRPCGRGHVAARSTASGNCITCTNIRVRERRKRPEVRARAAAAAKVRRQNPNVKAATSAQGKAERRADPRLHLLALARRRARRDKVPFALKLRDIVVPPVCPVLGIPLFIGDGVSGPNSPTVDRVVPSHGYLAFNIAVISAKANSIKQNAQPHEVEAVARWMRTVWPEHLCY